MAGASGIIGPLLKTFTARFSRRIGYLLVSLGCVAVILVAGHIEPDPRGLGTHERFGLPPCSFLFLTGLPCPFCGVTTAFSHMAHGEIETAFVTQPVGALLFLGVVLTAVLCMVGFLTGVGLGARLARLRWDIVGTTIGSVCLVAWLYKIFSWVYQ